MKKQLAFCAVLAGLAAVVGGGSVAAQPAAQTKGITRTVLQTHDVPGTNYEAVQGIAEIAPNVPFPRHTHPGVEISYILQGTLVLDIQGQPEQIVPAGKTCWIPAGAPHSGHAGPAGAKILAMWIVEKGKPLASPAK
jgi:quercetin dioxygenase-like cupin family protein